jgi:hypothetical protein
MHCIQHRHWELSVVLLARLASIWPLWYLHYSLEQTDAVAALFVAGIVVYVSIKLGYSVPCKGCSIMSAGLAEQ